MPAMANIVIKKADGTTDITYDALTGAGSDGSPAVWRQDTGAAATFPTGLRAGYWFKSLWNGPKTARKMHSRYERCHAVQNSTTTVFEKQDTLLIEVSATVPQGMPLAEILEGVHQGMNLAASTLIKQSMAAGYAPSQ